MVITQDDLGHVVSNTGASTGAFLGHGLRLYRINHRRAVGWLRHCPLPNTVALLNRVYRITKDAGLNAVADSNAPIDFIHHHHQQERYPALIPAVITAMHSIELIGSYAARHVESGLTVDLTSRRNRSTTKGPLSPLCRKLLDLGHDPNCKVHVIRKALDRDGHIPVFQRDRTLKTWAGIDCIESETRSLHVRKYRPYPAAVEAID